MCFVFCFENATNLERLAQAISFKYWSSVTSVEFMFGDALGEVSWQDKMFLMKSFIAIMSEI